MVERWLFFFLLKAGKYLFVSGSMVDRCVLFKRWLL